MYRKTVILLLAGLTLVLAACSAPGGAAGPSDVPTPAGSGQGTGANGLPTPVTAPAATTSPTEAPAAVTPTGAGSATATVAPMATESIPTKSAAERATAAPATSSAATPAAAGGSPSTDPPAGSALTLKLDPAASQALFRVREQLAGRNFPNDAVGTTKNVTGQLVIQPDGKIVAGQSRFVVNLNSLQTDEARRDRFIKSNTLEVSRYPEAIFVPTSVSGLPSPLPMGGSVSFQLAGDLTLHGVTKPTTWQVTGTVDGGAFTGKATTTTTFGEFGMDVPRAAVVLSVEDKIGLEMDFRVVKQ